MPKKRGTSWRALVDERVARRRRFEQMVADALDDLPDAIARKLANVEIVVEDGSPTHGTLGLYHGIPQTERDAGYSGVLPDVITIYRLPLEARARSEAELEAEVRATVRHEIAHHFGISDERLREMGVD